MSRSKLYGYFRTCWRCGHVDEVWDWPRLCTKCFADPQEANCA